VKRGKSRRPRRPGIDKARRRPRLSTRAIQTLPGRIPKRWVKLVVGIFLLPLAWVLTETFFSVFARATVRDRFWQTEEFWFFSLGAVLWLVAFFGLPRPRWLYVFGHELTHAISVMLLGGRVHRFQVSADGGHVLADRTNTLIALAPYFFPIYSALAIVVYGILGLFLDVTPYRPILYAVIGATWSMHLSFTCWMIPKGQPDLHYGGTFFSLVLIYVVNLTLLAVLLVIASPQLAWPDFGREFLQNSANLAAGFASLARRLLP
jgi:hypothetical protein